MINTILLDRYQNKCITYIPNPGHIGDALIAYATMQLFDQLGLKYTIGQYTETYENQDIIYGGGGNLVGPPKLCENFLLNNIHKNSILMLPHTIKDVDHVITKFDKNVTVFCRETISYEYVKNTIKYPENVFIDHDMAFGLDCSAYMNRPTNGWHLNCFRVDSEKINIPLPNDNIDFTLKCSFPALTENRTNIEMASNLMLNFISLYDTITTNRLHVAIAGTLMNKKIKLYNNLYYKNKAVYEYSMNNKYPNITFVY